MNLCMVLVYIPWNALRHRVACCLLRVTTVWSATALVWAWLPEPVEISDDLGTMPVLSGVLRQRV